VIVICLARRDGTGWLLYFTHTCLVNYISSLGLSCRGFPPFWVCTNRRKWGFVWVGRCLVTGDAELCSVGNIYMEDRILSSNLITYGRWIPITPGTMWNALPAYTGDVSCFTKHGEGRRGLRTLSSQYKSNFPPLWIAIQYWHLIIWTRRVIYIVETSSFLGQFKWETNNTYRIKQGNPWPNCTVRATTACRQN
jgi:hypothetical protein